MDGDATTSMRPDARADSDHKPLAGVVLCCTAIPPEQRYHMAQLAQEMGAVHRLDLTVDVTHLIIGDINTEKYRYTAKERQDIKVLHPDWLDAVRDSWIKGGEIDVVALETAHKLPALSGLKICVTGFLEPEQRKELQDAVNANGAIYHGDLTKQVTHLVARLPEGKKYEFATQWGIKVVGVEWLKDSLHRGMVLEETLYHPSRPAEERGVGAVTVKRVVELGKRKSTDSQEIGKRKLRRTASSRLESQTDDLWADLGGGDLPVKEEEDEQLQGRRSGSTTPRAVERPEPPGPAAEPQREEPKSAPQIFNHSGEPDSGERMVVYGFDSRKTGILRDFLTANGAVILPNIPASDIVTTNAIIIVPHDMPSEESEDLQARFPNVLTDFWVEKCLHRKVLVDRLTPLCTPFWHGEIKGFEKLKICPTSFTGIDLLHFSKAVKLLGASYDEYLRPETSILICNETRINQDKLRYALERSIPIVSPHWLWDSISEQRLLSFKDFGITGQISSQPCFYHPVSNPRARVLKSSGRVKGAGQLELLSLPSFNSAPSSTTAMTTATDTASQNGTSTIAKGKKQPTASVNTATAASEPTQSQSQSQPQPQPLKQLRQQLNTRSNSSKPTPSTTPTADDEPENSPQLDADAGHVEFNHHRPDADADIPDHGQQKPSSQSRRAPSPAREPPSPSQKTKLTTELVSLLAARKASAAIASTTSALNPTRSRRKPFGRAISNPSSLVGGGVSLSRTNSSANGNGALDSGAGVGVRLDGQGLPAVVYEDEVDAALRDRGGDTEGKGKRNEQWMPSQVLGYEDPEAMAVREKLLRGKCGSGGGGGFGGELDGAGDEMRKVERIGVVTDGVLGDGMGRRRTGRRR